MAPRNTRSKQPPQPVPVVDIPTTRRTQPRQSRPFALPTTNADKDRLRERYSELYDKGEIAKNDVIAARSKGHIINSGRAFDTAIVSSSLFV